MNIDIFRPEIEVRKCLPPILDPLEIERRVEFGGGRVDLRRYSWSAPVACSWTTDKRVCTLNMAITPRPNPCQITQLDINRRFSIQGVGRTLLLLPGSPIFVKAATGHYRSIDCEFDLEEIRDGEDARSGLIGQLKHTGRALNNHIIESYMLKMYRELCDDKYGSEMAVEYLAKLVWLEIVRCFSRDHAEQEAPMRGGLAPWQMKAICERAHADAPAPDLMELADLCGISVRHLSREFKKMTGQAVGKYIENVTMDRAYHLLQDTSSPIGEIACALGFASSASFAYAFRRHTSFRPSEIRKKNCGGMNGS